MGQITRPTADQVPPVAGIGQHRAGTPNESVNPATGSLSIRLNAGVPRARGITVPFAFGYDSNAAQHFAGGLGLADNASYLGQGGWSYLVPVLTEIQNTYQVGNGSNTLLATQNPVDPQLFAPCAPDDPTCGQGNGGLHCFDILCPLFAPPPQTTTAPTPCIYYDHFTFFDMTGNVHDLGITSQNNTNDCTSIAGAPVTRLTGTDGLVLGNAGFPNGPPPAVTVVDSQGTFYSFPNSSMSNVHNYVGGNKNLRSFIGFAMLPSFVEDRNGNFSTFTDHGNGAFDITDTTGRLAISTSGFGVSGNTVTIAGFENPYTVTWSPLSSTWFSQAHFQITVPNVQSVPATTCQGGGGIVTWNNNGQPVPLQGISEIQIPNGQIYQFQYDPIYGLVTKMIYPTGGYVRYIWGISASAYKILIPSTEPIASSGDVPLPCEVVVDAPVVVQRFVSFDGQAEVEEQDFTYTTTWGLLSATSGQNYTDWTSKQTTVVTKDLVTEQSFKTVYTYIPAINESQPTRLEGAGGFTSTSPAEQTVQNFDENGKSVRTVNKKYGNALTAPEVETTTLDNGLVSQVRSCIANVENFVFVNGCLDTSVSPFAVGGLPVISLYLGGLVTDRYEYDYGSGVPGALLRHTHNNYTLFKNSLFPDVFANSFGNPTTYLGVPNSTIVYDGSGVRVAETDYNYDEGGTASASAFAHDENNYGPAASSDRKNLTSISKKCFNAPSGMDCPDSMTSYSFDETGQVLSQKDPLGNTTTYSYIDSFSDVSPTKNTNAYLTTITLPPTINASHIQKYAYVYSDGEITSFMDQNGTMTQTTYRYDDPLRRVTEVDFADGGQTKLTYTDSGANPNVITTKKVTGSTSLITTTVLDGMDHIVQAQLNSDPAGVDFTDTAYDGLGRENMVSNPHRTVAASTDGVTHTHHDVLGRITKITSQDGSIRTATYVGPCTVTVDEAVIRHRQCRDALGRLTEVDEPTPGTSETITVTNATATVSINGNLQAKQLQNFATGIITISGTDSTLPGTSAYDFGTVSVFVGTSGSASTQYGNSGASPSTSSDVASALCNAINSTSSTSSLVGCTGANNGIINLTAQAAGSAGNGLALAVRAQTQMPQANQSAFSGSSTSGSLSGGGAILDDSGNTTITISGIGDTVSWSGSGTTSASIASSLATAMNGDANAFVTAIASGNTVSLTSKIAGMGGNLGLTCSSGYDSSNFTGPSFTISCPSALSGGKEAGSLSVPVVTLYYYDALDDLIQAIQQGGVTDQSQWRTRIFSYDSLSRLRKAVNPESGTVTYKYDADGNLSLKTSPQANQSSPGAATFITYCYDQLNRRLAKGYALSPNPPQQCSTTPPYLPNPAAAYIYDVGANGIGRLTSLTDQGGSATYTYDVMGRVLSEQRQIAGITKSMGYKYNFDSSVATASYPSGAVITYTPASAGQNTAGLTGLVQDLENNVNYVVGPSGPGTFATYAPNGILTGSLLGQTSNFAGISESFSFNSRLQPIAISTVAPNLVGVDATATVSINGSLNSATVTGSGNAPPAASGSALTSFVASDGSSHTFYEGSNQHIYHLFWNSSGGWQDQDVSVLANNAIAASSSALTSFATSDGNYHVVYLDANNHVNQLASSGANWSVQDITAASNGTAAVSSSALTGYAGSYSPHIYYQGSNQHIYQFWLNGSSWVNNDLTAASGTNILPASNSKLTSFVDSYGEHSFYLGSSGHVYHLFWNGSALANQDISAMAALDLVDGPCAFEGSTCFTGSGMWIVGFGANGAYNFLTVTTGSVACNTATFGDPSPGVSKACYLVNQGFPVAATGSALSSFSDSNGGHVYYLTSNAHDHLLWFDGQEWHDEDETSFSATSVVAAGGSALTSFSTSDLNEHSVYLGTNRHIYHMLYNSSTATWTNQDLTAMTGTSVLAIAGSALTAFGLSAGNPGHVQYLDSNGHVNHLYFDGSAWHNQDLTAIAISTSTVFDSGVVTLNVGGFNGTACFGVSTNSSCTGQASNNTAAQVATALASAINVSASPATATVSGATINLTWKTGGNVTAAVAALATSHDQLSVFGSPSFTSSATNFSGGGAGSPVTVFSLNYDFHSGTNDNGDVWGITNNKDTTRNQTFTYDALNRLSSAANNGTDCNRVLVNNKTKFWGNSYGYDPWGNLLEKSVTKCSAENLNMVVLPNNQFSGYGYDAAGNMTSDLTDMVTATYDPENQLATATQNGITTSYTYDDEGNRVQKSAGSTGTLYWFMNLGIVAESDLAGTLRSEYVFLNGKRIARRDLPSGAVSYYFSDYLNTTEVVTDSQGTIKSESDFLPWGGELQFSNNDSNHYKFIGKERDAETGLDYFGARYYSSRLSRFLSPDPKTISSNKLADPQQWNMYSYARNNPIANIDSDGEEPVKSQATTPYQFSQVMNNTRTKIGLTTHFEAQDALRRLGETHMTLKGPLPTTTPPFNLGPRYIYTDKGGWIDMVHFLFYAGRAYTYLQDGEKNPIGKAVQDGYHQEKADSYFTPHSAYSYEDLPSDRFGAEFAVKYFDPASNEPLSKQIENYLNKVLSANLPQDAPNWKNLPDKDVGQMPFAQDQTTQPIFTQTPGCRVDPQ